MIDWRQGREALKFCNSYNRLPKLIELWESGDIPPRDWLMLLRSEWEVCDNISAHLGDLMLDTPLAWLTWMDDDALQRAFMSAKEWRAFQALPLEVTIWRGCYECNRDGLSWSLDCTVAARFPTLHRYRQAGQPLLIEARATKGDCLLALKLGRNETEAVAYDPQIVSVSEIEPSPLNG